MSELLKRRYHQLNFFEEKNNESEQKFIASHTSAIPISIRIHPLKYPKNKFIDFQQIPWCRNGYFLPERPYFAHDPLWHTGAYYVQEANSMIIGSIIEGIKSKSDTPLKILDLSAAPGGKTTHIISVLDEEDLLISNEVIATRCSILLENVTKWGYDNNWVTNLDPKQFSRLKDFFDIIVIDAPCSGSGLWRKDTKALEDWNESLVKLCSERQQRIISDVIPSLKDGGKLIYSTCSYSVEENENISKWICEEFPFKNYKVDINNDWHITKSINSNNQSLGYRLQPWNVMGEGFYFNVMIKDASDNKQEHLPKKINSKNNKNSPITIDTKLWVKGENHFFEFNDEWHFIPLYHKETMEYLLSTKIHFKKIGTTLGKIIKNELIPHHDIAMSIKYSQQQPRIELCLAEALEFLRKATVNIEHKESGWYIVTYLDVPLGWVKVIGNRVNNYYPKGWRLIK